MMTRFTMTLLVLAAAATAGVGAQCLSPDDGGGGAEAEMEATEAEMAALRRARTDFALALLRESSTEGAEGGAGAAVVSPRSAFDALMLALLGAANATESALRDTLRLPHDLSKAGAWRAMRGDTLDEVKDLGEGEEGVRSVNRLWLAKQVALRPCLAQLLNDSVESVDILGDTPNAVAHMNAWVSEHTAGRIPDIVPSNLHPHAQLVLTNAAFFRGRWASRFPHNATNLQVFHTAPDRRTLVPMMKQRGSFSYVASERLGAHAIELPFTQEGMSLLLLLPPFASPAAAGGGSGGGVEGGVDALLGRLDAASLGELLRDADGSAQAVDVEMPRLELEAAIDLVPVLKRLGAGDAFTMSGDFSSFTGELGPSFDGVRQRARLEADEEGATAAAATAVFLFRSARPVDPPRFIANHPFIFLLLSRYPTAANAAAPALSAAAVDVLFAGVYRGPSPGAAARFVRRA